MGYLISDLIYLYGQSNNTIPFEDTPQDFQDSNVLEHLEQNVLPFENSQEFKQELPENYSEPSENTQELPESSEPNFS